MERQKKKQNGITLIALVISIIVMLILAGVSLNLTIGEDGIISQAQNAKIAQEDAVWNENAETILAEALMNKDFIENLTLEELSSAGGDESAITALKLEKMKNYLYNKFSEVSEDPSGVIVSLVEDGYLIVDGERVFSVDYNFSKGINVVAEKMLVETNENWRFTPLANGLCKLSICVKEVSGEVKIPAIVVDKENKVAYKVSELGDNLFNYATRITKIDFSEVGSTLTKIGAGAFANCSNLEITVPDELPNSVTYIGDKAFYGCKKLQGNINTIQNHGYTLGKGVFMKCPNLSGDIQSVFNENFYLENEVPVATVVEESQFSGYSGLTGNLVIPNYITKIGNNAFYGCTSIESLSFQEESTCTELGNNAFYGCTGMTNSVVLPNSITSLGNYCFTESGITGVTLPNAMTSINAYAFYYCENLKSDVSFPASITTIGEYAFAYSGVKSLYFNYDSTNKKGIQTISRFSFCYCKSLTTIDSSDTTSFPQTLTTLGNHVFYRSTNVASLSLPDSLTSIGSNCFSSCNKMDITRWPSNLSIINSSTFSECSSLTTLPNQSALTKIYASAFWNCKKLGYNNGNGTNIITWLENSSVDTLQTSAFQNASYLSGSWDGTIDGITISGTPFYGTGVTLSLTLPTNATSISASQFAGATSVTYNGTTYSGTGTLTLPSTVTSIGASAFSGCKAFSKIIIPSSVTSIGNYAFEQCTATDYEFASGSPITTISSYMFMRSKINNIVWPSGVTTINNGAFYNCGNLKSITIPSTVKTIGSQALAWCSISTLNFNNGLETIGSSCCVGNGFTEIVIPDTVTNLGNNAFGRCTTLKKITFGSGITNLPDNICGFELTGDAYTEKGQLETVIIKGKITSIGTRAFCKQPKLKTITFNNGSWDDIRNIGQQAFYNCELFTDTITLNRECILYENSFENCPANVSK